MHLSLANPDVFEHRHTGSGAEDLKAMLHTVGVNSLEELIAQTIPASIRAEKPMNLPGALSEWEYLSHMRDVAAKNKVFHSYIGMGYYDTHTPGVILRNVMENPGWYTAYTPYQAEISQGRLEALLNFQTMVIDLTGLEIANASLLDEATAAAEAMHMAYDVKGKENGNKFFVAFNTFPQTIDLLKTRSEAIGIELEVGDPFTFTPDKNYFGAIIQYPDDRGEIHDYRAFANACKAADVRLVVATDLLALCLLTPPGEWGADMVVGSSQRFGIPMGYGGPHAAFLTTKEEYKRSMPGRIIGVSIDVEGNTALRMALQTREQHIRREKATSNICTAQVLLSVMAGFYATYHGPQGLKRIAGKVHGLAKVLSDGLKELGFENLNKTFFDTLYVRDNGLKSAIENAAISETINFRYFADGHIGISLDECTTMDDVHHILNVFAKASGKAIPSGLNENQSLTWDSQHIRTSAYLTHPVFNQYHTEHEMLRYIKHLEGKDLSLCHSMIPLGSCTMKLNATSEMAPVTWPEFGNIHPFAPLEQAKGYAYIFDELSKYLTEVTGFPGISLQPNSGAQGEYAGLLVIREYFKSRNEQHRNVALIPASAHGTNPASAVMAGFKVVVTKTDENGNIDVADLAAKAEQYKDNLGVLMVTYPSTHGVFEESIVDITNLIHAHGGQVYMDGANMNAQVGLTSPARIGADVCHLNLHKTFCIPHGGGGPGMGPIGVAAHLKPFLPGHAVVKTGGEQAGGAVSAAPWGSASILLISYGFIRMMGADGLTRATQYAILNANYIKTRLEGHYKTLYVGKNGRVAHEMILDTRGFKATSGVEAEDIAKRLMDYGYHAPTLSFPVANTLMVEPTESESKAELDRFIDAMIGIRNEIREIEEGQADKEDNVLQHAPHPVHLVISDSWNRPYSREKAAYPAAYLRHSKFWPSVTRVNSTYGDRNLVCACPPIESYHEAQAVSA